MSYHNPNQIPYCMGNQRNAEPELFIFIYLLMQGFPLILIQVPLESWLKIWKVIFWHQQVVDLVEESPPVLKHNFWQQRRQSVGAGQKGGCPLC